MYRCLARTTRARLLFWACTSILLLLIRSACKQGLIPPFKRGQNTRATDNIVSPDFAPSVAEADEFLAASGYVDVEAVQFA